MEEKLLKEAVVKEDRREDSDISVSKVRSNIKYIRSLLEIHEETLDGYERLVDNYEKLLNDIRSEKYQLASEESQTYDIRTFDFEQLKKEGKLKKSDRMIELEKLEQATKQGLGRINSYLLNKEYE